MNKSFGNNLSHSAIFSDRSLLDNAKLDYVLSINSNQDAGVLS
jgi:hypothetical protein